MIVVTPPCTCSCHVLPTNLCALPSRDVGRVYQQRLRLRLNAHCTFSSNAKLWQKKIFIRGYKKFSEFMTDRQQHTLTSQSSSPSWRTLTTSDSNSDGNTNSTQRPAVTEQQRGRGERDTTWREGCISISGNQRIHNQSLNGTSRFSTFPFVHLSFQSSQLSDFLTRFQDVARNDLPTTMNSAISSSLNRSLAAAAQVQVLTVVLHRCCLFGSTALLMPWTPPHLSCIPFYCTISPAHTPTSSQPLTVFCAYSAPLPPRPLAQLRMPSRCGT
jgi:hypothetical protein